MSEYMITQMGHQSAGTLSTDETDRLSSRVRELSRSMASTADSERETVSSSRVSNMIKQTMSLMVGIAKRNRGIDESDEEDYDQVISSSPLAYLLNHPVLKWFALEARDLVQKVVERNT